MNKNEKYHPPQLGVIEAFSPRRSRFLQQPGFNPRSDTPPEIKIGSRSKSAKK